MDDQDIKQHFQKSYEFIEQGRNDGAVLVHWYVVTLCHHHHYIISTSSLVILIM